MGSIRTRQGRYQARVRRKGYATVTKTFTSREVAKRWIKSTEIAIEQGEFIRRTNMAVGDMLEKYANEYLPKLKGAAISTQYRVRALKRHFGDIALADLSTSHLAKYRDKRLKTVKPITVKCEMDVLRWVINVAITEWDVPLQENPCSKMKWKNVDVPRDRVMDDDEEIRLLKHSSPMLAKMIIVAVETAMRLGEICNIRKRDINFHNQTLHIPQTKTDKPRTIPLSKRGLNVLIEQLRALGNVIPLSDTPLFMYQYCKPPSYRAKTFREFQRARNSAGITDLRFHDLRHTATTRLFERGLGIMEVASITGHEDLKMLKRYTHIKPESLVARLG